MSRVNQSASVQDHKRSDSKKRVESQVATGRTETNGMADMLLALQRSAGNNAVNQLLQKQVVQRTGVPAGDHLPKHERNVDVKSTWLSTQAHGNHPLWPVDNGLLALTRDRSDVVLPSATNTRITSEDMGRARIGKHVATALVQRDTPASASPVAVSGKLKFPYKAELPSSTPMGALPVVFKGIAFEGEVSWESDTAGQKDKVTVSGGAGRNKDGQGAEGVGIDYNHEFDTWFRGTAAGITPTFKGGVSWNGKEGLKIPIELSGKTDWGASVGLEVALIKFGPDPQKGNKWQAKFGTLAPFVKFEQKVFKSQINGVKGGWKVSGKMAWQFQPDYAKIGKWIAEQAKDALGEEISIEAFSIAGEVALTVGLPLGFAAIFAASLYNAAASGEAMSQGLVEGGKAAKEALSYATAYSLVYIGEQSHQTSPAGLRGADDANKLLESAVKPGVSKQDIAQTNRSFHPDGSLIFKQQYEAITAEMHSTAVERYKAAHADDNFIKKKFFDQTKAFSDGLSDQLSFARAAQNFQRPLG